MNPPFTQHPEVNLVLEALLPEVQAILQERCLGMYLYGSLAYGGFDRDSDVDFLVLTDGRLPDAVFEQLREMHDRIARLDSWCATQLEGCYSPLSALQVFDPVNVFHIHIDRGPGERLQRMHIQDPSLQEAWWGGWVVMRHVVREHAIVLAGPAPASFLPPTPPEELKRSVVANLEGWARPILADPSPIRTRGYQSYFVLTMCRSLYTLESGALAPKREAAEWAQKKLAAPWPELIERAWVSRSHPDGPPDPEEIRATQDFVRFTLELSQRKGKI
jgi:hypothetical protein